MAFTLKIKSKARKNLSNIQEDYRSRIIAALDEIVLNPFAGKKLSGKRNGQYSVRVWPYRIIYIVKKMELLVLIIDIDHRQGIY